MQTVFALAPRSRLGPISAWKHLYMAVVQPLVPYTEKVVMEFDCISYHHRHPDLLLKAGEVYVSPDPVKVCSDFHVSCELIGTKEMQELGLTCASEPLIGNRLAQPLTLKLLNVGPSPVRVARNSCIGKILLCTLPPSPKRLEHRWFRHNFTIPDFIVDLTKDKKVSLPLRPLVEGQDTGTHTGCLPGLDAYLDNPYYHEPGEISTSGDEDFEFAEAHYGDDPPADSDSSDEE